MIPWNTARFIFPLNLCTCFIIWILSVGRVQATPCLSSNVSYALCPSSTVNPSLNSKSFTKAEFESGCTSDFAEKILDHSCHRHSSHSHAKRKAPTNFEKYVYGFSAVFIVSGLSLAGLLAFPFLYKISFQYVLTLFTALAVGTLFGDTMFHLIPFALNLHGDHSGHSHASFSVPDYVWKMLISVLILYSFYLLEVLLHSFAHYKHKTTNSVHFHAHGHSHSKAHHNHSHGDGEICEHTPIDIDADLEHDHRLHNHRHHNLHQHVSNELTAAASTNLSPCHANNNNNHSNSKCVPCAYSNDVRPAAPMIVRGSNENLAEQEDQAPLTVLIKDSQGKLDSKSTNPVIQQLKMKSAYTPAIEHESIGLVTSLPLAVLLAIKSTGWMVLIGDGIHNFADGLAIGAAFSEDLILGATTTLAVAFHELPHELGDYAVLIQSGFSHYRALLWNFLSATTAVLGFFIGATISTNEHIRQWIFAVTVGMFLYIALVDLLPTLLADGQVDVKRFLVVNIGFLLGIAIMFLLALFEDSLIRSSR